MKNPQNGITYQPDDQTERRARVDLAGVTFELVRVPPVAHAFHRRAARHLLMFTEQGTRRDGESRAYGQPTSTLRDTAGTFSLIPADCPYEGWSVPSLPAEYLAITIDPAAPVLDPAQGLAALCDGATVYRLGLPAEVRMTLGKLRRAIGRPGGLDTLRAETLLSLLIQEMQEWLATPAPRESRGAELAPWQQQRATAMLDSRLDGGIGIAELAAACGLSPSHFARAFHRSMGMPPHRWLLHRRVERARDLLHRTDMPLAEVALACGFASQSHFGRVFAAVLGQPPGAWRRAVRR